MSLSSAPDLQHSMQRKQQGKLSKPRDQDKPRPQAFIPDKHSELPKASALPITMNRGLPINQQFISLIANVGSTILDAEGGEAEQLRDPLAQTQYFTREERFSARTGNTAAGTYGRRQVKPRAQDPMLKSMPVLRKPMLRHEHRASFPDPMMTSQILERPRKVSQSHQRHEGVLSIEESPYGETKAEETLSNTEPASSHTPEEIADIHNPTMNVDKPAEDVDLADMLVRVFGFKDREEVIADYPCYLMQSSLLQGALYILKSHICFYAYAPKRSVSDLSIQFQSADLTGRQSMAMKSGFLWKRGRQNPKYNRYWFVLKGNVLSYYKDASQLYFPRNMIDLRSATSVELAQPKDSGAESLGFIIDTPQQKYLFKAETLAIANEWLRQIQHAILRSKNESDSVKLALPVASILDIEENPIMDAADTFRLKVVDNDETFVVDEYFFTFFGRGIDAFNDMRAVIEGTSKMVDHEPGTYQTVQQSHQLQDSSGNDLVGVMQSVVLDVQHRLPSSHGQHQDRQSMDLSISTHDSEDQAPASATRRTSIGMQTSGPARIKVHLPNSGTEVHNPLDGSSADVISSRPQIKSSGSFQRLQDVLKVGVYPLQKASGLAGMLTTHSKRVGNLLAHESAGYYEKAYSMWAGKKMHYDEGEGPYPRFTVRVDDEPERKHGDRFREHFSLPHNEKLQATYYSYLSRVVPVYGKIYVGNSRLCFRSLLPGTRTKMILPLKDIENVAQEKGFRFGYSGLVVGVRGHEEIFFEFREADARDDCALTVLDLVESLRLLQESRVLTEEELENMAAARTEHALLEKARRSSSSSHNHDLPNIAHGTGNDSPVLFDDPLASVVTFSPPEPLNIVCLTIGSRGDVQPFIALCKGLIADGHKATIATHTEFEDWIRRHGIGFVPVAGNPAEIMRLCVENDMFTVNFLREAHAKFRGFIDELLDSAYDACQGADLLIEAPSAMAGIHIAEALQIPYFRAFTMPWTRTRAYPHAFAVPSTKLGGNYNMMTYVMFDNVFWRAMAGQINRWRKKRLSLPSTNLDKLQADKIPFLYNFSPSVVIPPLDFNHWIRITGYWFLDEGEKYEPDPKLVEFMRQARSDGKKIVYVGFGSIVVEDSQSLTKAIVEAVVKADVRCILSKGWSDRLDNHAAITADISLPNSIYQIVSAPHDWLFGQVDAAAHHGGAGTTGASIRAGIPTIAKPFFGDQYFFGARVQDLGVGICLSEITSTVLAQALQKATTDKKLIDRARRLGEQIRSENGVQTAIQAIYRDLDYAKSLIKRQTTTGEVNEGSEESWTMIDDESDLENAKHYSGAQGMEFHSSLAQRRESESMRGSKSLEEATQRKSYDGAVESRSQFGGADEEDEESNEDE